MWLEVETKVKLNSSDVPELREKIKRIARFKARGKKADDYFAIKSKGYPKKAFRIRAMKNKFEVNFKKHLKKYWTKEIVVKKEFEFQLKGKDEVESLLTLFNDLNFVEWVRKIKWNETYKHKKDKRISIEINRVKHLGYFMEIEYLCKPREMKKGRRKILRVLKELDIKPSQIDNTGYTRMLWDKGTKEKRKFLERSING
ncbi:CYTH domain-containing protein [Candidatus Woesearchaeota archaeon]|nr:CYTH domain-containing protein [Candidatus Woesearchaeota archaeon]MBT4321581.1 CYTH domain-containing protein [Candidatus Woesearchaeota archaeon]